MDNNVIDRLKGKIKLFRSHLDAYSTDLVKIKDKSGKECEFKLNKAQEYSDMRINDQMERKGYVRAIMLKGRQQGMSKYNCLRGLRNTTLHTNTNMFVMAHDAATTSSLFKDYKDLYKSLPDNAYFKPSIEASNAKELIFGELGSQIKVGTAGSAEVGRGTTIHKFHGSECGFWKNGDKLLAGVLQAVPLMRNTEIILESTANGMGNKFHTMCMQAMKGEGEFELIFIPWWWTDEYQLDAPEDYEPNNDEWDYYDTYISRDCDDEDLGIKKLYWRKQKIVELGESKFKQEYPATPQEAFQMSGSSLFNPDITQCAVNTNLRENINLPLIIGVDAAEAGGDRTVICFRRGNKVTKFQCYDEMDQMRLAGIVAKIIEQHNPYKVYFDKAYAQGTVERLKELGYKDKVKAIPFASKPIEQDRFVNKRAEMHIMAKEWLEQGWLEYDPDTKEGGVDLPENDAFLADLACVPEPVPTSNGKIKIKEKAKIKEEYGLSPDYLDAFILTFAEPVQQYKSANKIKVKGSTATGRIYKGK